MIKYEEAIEIVLNNAKSTGIEEVDFEDALNRVLAEDVIANYDMPLFNKSRMDGYACRREDLGGELSVIDTVYASQISKKMVKPKTCIKIMTGAVVPNGADCVIKVEETTNISVDKITFDGKETNQNISFKGEDFKKGDIILTKGTLLKPQHIAVLAILGHIKPKVAVRPRVSLLVTGDELVQADESLKEGFIRDSNTPQIKAQIKALGAEVVFSDRIGDNLQKTIEALKKAVTISDLVLLSGGVSMGDYDFFKKAIAKLGGRIIIEKIAVKPGKPAKFAILDNVCCIGLPGNPVSSFVQFEILAKPLLYQMMNYNYQAITASFILTEDFTRSDTRKEWYPVKILDNHSIKPLKQKSSGDIASLADADGLMIIEQNILELKKGAEVNVRLLRT